MRWVTLGLLGVAVGFGLYVATCGLCREHGRGEIRGSLRVWGQHGDRWVGELQVDPAAMQRRTGQYTRQFLFVVTDPEVAHQVQAASKQAGLVEVEYTKWLIKPMSHRSDITVVSAKPPM